MPLVSITVVYTKYWLRKDANLSSFFQEKHDLMSLAFPRLLTRSHFHL